MPWTPVSIGTRTPAATFIYRAVRDLPTAVREILDGVARFVLSETQAGRGRPSGERLMDPQLDNDGYRSESPVTDSASGPRSPAVTTEDAVDFPIFAIGASAGGLESLERLFSHLPTDTGMAFVVLQHLSPDFKSLMDELLARRTSMPVRQADHNLLVEP